MKDLADVGRGLRGDLASSLREEIGYRLSRNKSYFIESGLSEDKAIKVVILSRGRIELSIISQSPHFQLYFLPH